MILISGWEFVRPVRLSPVCYSWKWNKLSCRLFNTSEKPCFPSEIRHLSLVKNSRCPCCRGGYSKGDACLLPCFREDERSRCRVWRYVDAQGPARSWFIFNFSAGQWWEYGTIRISMYRAKASKERDQVICFMKNSMSSTKILGKKSWISVVLLQGRASKMRSSGRKYLGVDDLRCTPWLRYSVSLRCFHLLY